jgi:hypothetical protein
MNPAYAFLAAFTWQILVMSVLYPAWFVRHIRRTMPKLPADRLAQLYPGVDPALAVERFLSRFRLANLVIAVLGLPLWGWFFRYTQRPDWDDGPIEALGSAYFFLQAVPLMVVALLQARLKKKLLAQTTAAVKRTATLRRRGLFDFVSPLVVAVAGLCYAWYAAFVFYIDQHPFPGFAGVAVNIGFMTLLYAMEGFAVYWLLYGRKINRLETDASSIRLLGLGVRACVIVCIAAVVHQSVNFMLVLQDLQRWEPFAASLFLVFCATLCMTAVIAPPRDPDMESFESTGLRQRNP